MCNCLVLKSENFNLLPAKCKFEKAAELISCDDWFSTFGVCAFQWGMGEGDVDGVKWNSSEPWIFNSIQRPPFESGSMNKHQ